MLKTARSIFKRCSLTTDFNWSLKRESITQLLKHGCQASLHYVGGYQVFQQVLEKNRQSFLPFQLLRHCRFPFNLTHLLTVRILKSFFGKLSLFDISYTSCICPSTCCTIRTIAILQDEFFCCLFPARIRCNTNSRKQTDCPSNCNQHSAGKNQTCQIHLQSRSNLRQKKFVDDLL